MALPLPSALHGFTQSERWVTWKWVTKANGSKTKEPFRARFPAMHASTSQPNTWAPFSAALKTYQSGLADGVGYVVREDEDHIFLDLDKCRDPATGEVAPWAMTLVEEANSYTEITPSGTGLRIIGTKGWIANPIHAPIIDPDGHEIEVYFRAGRYVTVSGVPLPGTPDQLNDISEVTIGVLERGGTKRIRPGQEPEERKSNIEPTRSIEAVRAALAVIPNDRQDWHHWSMVGMATWRTTGGSAEGREAWRDWSARNPIHDDADLDERWRHWFISPPTKLGFGTLYHLARKARPLFVAPYDPVLMEAPPFEEAAGQDYDPETGEILPSLPATRLTEDLLTDITPRRWLYGRELLRGFVSVLGSPGGVGKTAYTFAVGASLALERPLLAHDQRHPSPFQAVHKPGAVWFYNLEDPIDELLRRLKALLLHQRIGVSDLKHPVYVDSGQTRDLIITKRSERGDLVAHPVVEALVEEIQRRNIALLVVDPFVQSHTAEENRNEEMNFVMALWRQVARRGDCAVWLIHHFRKGGQGGDGDSFRGAGAIQGAARVMSTLSAMSLEEASKLGVDPEQRRQFVRLDNAKANMAPSATRAEWYQLVSVAIGNTQDPDYPEGDHVQTVQPWDPPSPWEGLGWATIVRILDQIQAGPTAGEHYSLDRRSKERWAARVLIEMVGSTEGQAVAILKAWLENGVLEEGQYASPSRKGAITGCVTVVSLKAAEMRAKVTLGGEDAV